MISFIKKHKKVRYSKMFFLSFVFENISAQFFKSLFKRVNIIFSNNCICLLNPFEISIE